MNGDGRDGLASVLPLAIHLAGGGVQAGSVIITPAIFTIDMDVSSPAATEVAASKGIDHSFCTNLTLHDPSLLSTEEREPACDTSEEPVTCVVWIPSPEMTKGQFTRSFWNNLCGSPMAYRPGCWSNKEAKLASVKANQSPWWVARTSSGERIIRSNASMHRCISLHVIISLVLSLLALALALGAHIPLAHHKPRTIARWAAGAVWLLAGWLAGWLGGLAEMALQPPPPRLVS
ncbi:hypothetical protein V494_00923 [Pseudogymnoascus sp. VKM F-4513 (FW-928)]|nr:hypothetical protein V494_00923 [Pseudogymnoascus sp. VKM F-4513 (FW-928)]